MKGMHLSHKVTEITPKEREIPMDKNHVAVMLWIAVLQVSSSAKEVIPRKT